MMMRGIHFGALTIILESVNYMHLIFFNAYIQVVSWCVFIRIQHLACLCHQWLYFMELQGEFSINVYD